MYSIDTTLYIPILTNFLKHNGILCNLNNPQTIQEKLAYLNIYNCPMHGSGTPLKTLCADKIKLHDYSKEILGKDICIPIIKIYNSISDINWDELPNQFVMKCNHGSGMNIICKDKTKLNKQQSIKDLTYWMNDDFTFRNGFEAHYHDIHHKIFIEELQGNGNGELLDYKFWCFNGIPKLYTINSGNGHGDIMYYNMDHSEYNLYNICKHSEYLKPNQFELMKEYAIKLAKPFKFVRVDFYEVGDKVYLGELTFTPGAMVFKYDNPEDNIKIGNMLKL